MHPISNIILKLASTQYLSIMSTLTKHELHIYFGSSILFAILQQKILLLFCFKIFNWNPAFALLNEQPDVF